MRNHIAPSSTIQLKKTLQIKPQKQAIKRTLLQKYKNQSLAYFWMKGKKWDVVLPSENTRDSRSFDIRKSSTSFAPLNDQNLDHIKVTDVNMKSETLPELTILK